jgi:hypothetical protein
MVFGKIILRDENKRAHEVFGLYTNVRITEEAVLLTVYAWKPNRTGAHKPIIPTGQIPPVCRILKLDDGGQWFH